MDVEEDQAEEDMEIPPEERKIDVVDNLDAEDSIFQKIENEIRASPVKQKIEKLDQEHRPRFSF